MTGDARIVPEFRVLLECGHTVRARNPPQTDRVRFFCTYSLGCGYHLRWVQSWHVENPDRIDRNEPYHGSTNHEGDNA